MRLIVAGGRYFDDYDLLKMELDRFLSDVDGEIEIVSGMASGADSLGIKYAKEKGYPVKEFYAQWGQFGKKAGPLRNAEMANYATHCVCFWDGISKGTGNMIDLAEKNGLVTFTVGY
tara:strand:- start:4389 stop:4739 length:351 start_codon:yes stop_codon:yes gene_type:complete